MTERLAYRYLVNTARITLDQTVSESLSDHRKKSITSTLGQARSQKSAMGGMFRVSGRYFCFLSKFKLFPPPALENFVFSWQKIT